MNKKTILRSVIALILAVAAVFAVTAIAAEYVADDGMTFEIVTSKKEYGVNEEVQVILLAKNYNTNKKLAKVSWNATVPGEELTLLGGEIEGAQVVEVGERAVVNLRLMKIVEIPDEEPPATEPAPTTPVDKDEVEEVEEVEGPSAGSIVVLILLILLALAGIGGIVYLILKRRGVISCVALLLSLGMLLPCIPAVDVSAVELNPGEMVLGEDNTLNATVTFIVDGKEYEATATLTYKMEDQTETVVEAMYSSMSSMTWEEFSAPPVTPTIGEHPRLMFTQEDVPGIIKTLESEGCEPFYKEFYRLLGVDFNGSLGTPKEEVDDKGNVTKKSNFSGDKVNSVRVKALYYALFRDSEDPEKAHMAEYYGIQAVRACRKMLDTVYIPPNGQGKATDIYNVGDCQLAAAEVFDWCYDLLSHEDKQHLASRAQQIGSTSEGGWPISFGTPADTLVGHKGGNLIQTYWMGVAIAMYDEYPSMFETIAGWWFESFPATRDAWSVAGHHHQGACYGAGGRGDADLTAQYMIYSMTGGDNDRDGDGKEDGFKPMNPETFHSVSYGLLYSLRPDGQFLREGDSWEENQSPKNTIWDANAVHFERASNFYKDGILRRVAMELDNFQYSGTDFLYLFLTHDVEVETKKYSDLPYTKYFDIPSGSMTARTGWDMGVASNDVLARMQMTSVYMGPHQHHDAGSFQIYYKGILASESGLYTTVNVAHYRNYLTTSIAHNTLAITSVMNRYGLQVTPNTKWGAGEDTVTNPILGHEYGPNTYKPEYSYLAGDIAASYRSATDDNAREAVRSMLFLNLELDGNTEHPGAFIVFDQIKTRLPGSKKSFLLHMQSEPEVDGNTIIIKNTADNYNGMLTNQVLYVGTATQKDDAYTITKIGGPGKEYLVGSYNYVPSETPDSTNTQEMGWGRVEISTTTTVEEQTDYMLNVMYVGDADGDTTVIPAKLIYDGKGVVMGAQLMNHVAMFNMDGNHRISSDVSFTIPQNEGYSTFKVNVAGLQAGTWTVYVDGKSVGTQIASEDGGMIYFEAAAGTVKLVRSGSESNKTFDETPIVEEEPIGIMINNFYYYTDAHPVKSGDDYLFPVSVIFDALNIKGTWSRDKSTYTVKYQGKTYVIAPQSLTVDGNAFAFREIRAAAGDLLMDSATLMKLVEGTMYYDRFINRIRVTVDVENNVPRLSDEILYKFPTAVQVEAIIDKGYSTLPLMNTVDGNTTTRWTSQKAGNNICEAIYDFGRIVSLTDVVIYFWANENEYSNYVFDILVSKDGSTWTQVYDKAQSGEVGLHTWMDYYLTLPMSEEARYVKFVGHGRYRYPTSGKQNPTITNGWSILTEIIFLQKSVIDPNGAEITGNRLLAEAECFNKQDTVKIEKDTTASGREVVISNVAYTTNPGTVDAAKPQLSATFIPKRTGTHYLWARVNTSKVTSGDTFWVNIEGVTDSNYYAEKINVGKKDKNGYVWIKLGQYEDQIAQAKWLAGEPYTLSVISGCEGLIFDCFMISPEAGYVPYEDCYSKKTDIDGNVSVNAKDTIYEHSMAQSSGNDARLQSVSADGTVSQAYKNYVLGTKNLPGDLSLNILTDTSGVYSIYATVKVSSLSNDQFFYAISANDEDYKFTLCDLSEVATVTANQFVKIKLGEITVQAAESIYVRIKTCSKGVTFGTFSTTCELPEGVYKTTNGKVVVQAEDAKLQPAGVETIIVDRDDPDSYHKGEVATIVNSTGAVGGEAVRFMKQHSAWNQLMTVSSDATPHLTFQVMPDEGGEYYIWIKVYATKSLCGIYAWIDGGDDYYFWRQPLDLETYSNDEEDYIWVRLYQEVQGGTKIAKEHYYNWTARRVYTISLRGMYAGVKVDEILITNDPNDAPHNHSYSETWSGNDTHHWYALTCGCKDAEPRYYEEHFFEDHTDKECNTCGYANPNYAPHNYVDGKCTICGGLAPFKISGGKLTLEAENLMLAPDDRENHIPNYFKKPVIKVVEQENAAGGKAVQFLKTNSALGAFVNLGTTPIPHLSALVTPEKSGQYYIWLKVYAPANQTYGAYLYAYIEGGSDTYYWRQQLALDGYSKGEGDYFWVCLNQEWQKDTEKFADHTYNWTAGETYALRFRGTVVNVQIDQIYITDSASDVPHNHTWNSLKSYDDTYHWWTSSCHEGVITGKAEHNYENLKDTTCNDCNYVRPAHVCTFASTWNMNGKQHWHQCVCGDRTDVGDHNFVNGYCSTCNMSEPVKLTNGKVTLQGEDAMLAAAGTENVIANYTSAPASVKDNAVANAGKTLIFNKNHGGWNHLMYWDASAHDGQDPVSHATYYVTADVTGEYYIWLKVYTPNMFTGAAGDAVYCQIDGVDAEGKTTDPYFWRQPIAKEDGTYSAGASDFYWVRVHEEYLNQESAPRNVKSYNWTAGETYALRFRGYAAKVEIDEIYITNDINDAPHNHSFSTVWEKDDTHHWLKADCGHDLISGKTEHIYDSLKDTTCNVCNYVRPAHVCTFASSWSVSSTQHWHACVCGDKADVGDHNFVDGFCSVCNMVKPVKLTNGKGTLQGENAMLAAAGTENVIANYTSAPASVINNAAANAGKALIFNKNHGGWNHLMYWDASAHDGQDPVAHATYYVTADVTGEHYIWLKVYTPNMFTGAAGDAVYCQIDGVNAEGKTTDPYFWRQPIAKKDGSYSDDASDFYWVRVHEEYLNQESAPRNVKSYYWTAGETYALRFRGYAAKVQIDEIYITTDLNDPYVKNHEHTYSTQWSKDETHHWHAATCGHAEVVSGKGEHVFTNDADTTCNTCGAERHVHVYTNGFCACGAQKPFDTQGGTVVIEAENAALKSTNGKIVDKADASNGKVINAVARNPVGNALTVDTQGDIEFTVKPDVSGKYYIWVRVTTNAASKGIGTWVDGIGSSSSGDRFDNRFHRCLYLEKVHCHSHMGSRQGL